MWRSPSICTRHSTQTPNIASSDADGVSSFMFHEILEGKDRTREHQILSAQDLEAQGIHVYSSITNMQSADGSGFT